MILAMCIFLLLPVDWGINHSGRDISMIKQLLYVFQFGTMLDHMSRAAVAERVWVSIFVSIFHDAPDPLARERQAAS
jgi:hypothetical protein